MKPVSDPIVVAPRELSPERRLLWEAANEMERRGWCSGVSYNSDAVCTLNAIMYAGRRTGLIPPDGLSHHGEGPRAIHVLEKHVGVDCIPDWSNASDEATVISALRAAAVMP